MKNNMKKALAIGLCALLLLSTVLVVFAALSAPLPGQKELGIASVSTRPALDGYIIGSEYGLKYPHLRLKAGEDFWAEDANGNRITDAASLPEYVDLYLARKENTVYVAVSLPELESSSYQAYELTTFLGFGSDASSHTMNSGASTTFRMYRKTRSVYLKEWWETELKSLTAAAYEEDGTPISTSRLYNQSITVPNSSDYSTVDESAISFYPLGYWGEAKDGIATMEAELSLEDSVKASGLTWDKENVPEEGYFAFDLAIFPTKSATAATCILHFNADLEGAEVDEESPAETVPHILNLAKEADATINNPYLASLSATSSDGEFQYKVLPNVNENLTEYEMQVFDGTTAVEVKAIPAVDGATVTVTGADDLSPTGNNTIKVLVTSKGGFQREYTITVSWGGTVAVDYYVNAETGSDETGTGEEATPYKTIEKALEAIENVSETVGWNEFESARINLAGTNHSNQQGESVLFGQKTIFNKTGKKLPIVICGNNPETAVLSLAPADLSVTQVSKVACANDYTFYNLTFPIGDWSTKFYAGCGEVEFRSVILSKTYTGDETRGMIFGDNFTQNVFLGWTEENFTAAEDPTDGKLVSSVTFSGTTVFHSSTATTTLPNLFAVGAMTDEWETLEGCTFTPADTKAYLIIDGATVGRIGGRYGNSGVSAAFIEVKDGVTDRIVGDNGLIAKASTLTGDLTITVSGGKVNGANPSIQVLNNCVMTGKLTLNITGGEIKSTVRTAPFNGSINSLKGDSYFNMSGGKINGGVVIGPSNTENGGSGLNKCYFQGAVVNTVTGGEIVSESSFYHNGYLKADATTNPKRQIINNISGGTFGGRVYMGGTSGGWTHGTNCPNIINNISGGHFKSLVLCGHRYAYADSITNNISGSPIFDGDLVLGNPGGDAKLVLISTIEGGTFNGKIFCATSSGKVTTNFKGGTFNGEVFGSGTALYATKAYAMTSGTVTNNISGGIFNAIFYGGSTTADDYTSVRDAMGSSGTITVNASTVTIVNKISGGTFNAIFCGGSKAGTITANIQNTVTKGAIKKAFYGGNYDGTVTGNIVNTISGGTFSSHYYGGNYIGTVDGNIQNTLTCNGFKSNVSGANRGAAGKTTTVTGNVTNIIEGTFKMTGSSVFSGGSPDSTAPNTIEGQITNTVRKDSKGNVPQFGTYTFSFYGGGYQTVVGKGVQNNIEAGNFPTTFLAGVFTTRNGVIGKIEETDYSIINNISGGTFADRFQGGVITENTSYPLAGGVYNNVSGGTFNLFMGGNRTGTPTTKIVNLIKGGTFQNNSTYGYAFIAGCFGLNKEQQTTKAGSYITTIESGVFEGNVYGGGRGANPVETQMSLTIKGGTFQGKVYAGSTEENVSDALAALTIQPTVGDITFQNAIVVRNTSFDSTKLLGGSKKILLDSDVTLRFTSYDGVAQTIQQTEGWTDGTVYVTVPNSNAASLSVTKANGASGYVKKVTGENETQWVGLDGATLYAASLILNEKINIRLWFDKEEVDIVGNDFNYSVSREDLSGALVSGTYADLVANAEILTLEIDGVEKQFYTVILPGTAPSAFHRNFNVTGNGLKAFNGSINDILSIMITNEGSSYSEGLVTLAKTLWNYGIEAYNRFNGETSALEKETVAAPSQAEIVTKVNNNGDGSVTFVGKSLVLKEAVGIKFFANITADPANLVIKVNGRELTQDQFVFKTESSANYNASITVYVKALGMDNNVELEIYNGESFAASFTESVSSICQQYVNAASTDAALCTALLSYIEAIPGAQG